MHHRMSAQGEFHRVELAMFGKVVKLLHAYVIFITNRLDYKTIQIVLYYLILPVSEQEFITF